MEEFYKKLEDVIDCIKNSSEYKKCISIKEQMKDNDEINNLIKEIKNMQKKYIKSNYDSEIKEELKCLEDKLNNIPIYHIYNQELEYVNEKIEYVKDVLNEFFDKLLNK